MENEESILKYPFSLVDSCGSYLLLATHHRLVLYAMTTNQLWERRFDCEIIAMRGYSDDQCQRAAVATSNKQMFVFDVGTPSTAPACEWAHCLPKRVTCLEFADAGVLLVADRFGRVSRYRLDRDHSSQPPACTVTELPLELAHLSILTHLVLSKDARHIITADRDEKIRVSSFPDAFHIQCYCLGHLSFVTSLVEVDAHIVSASADGTLRIWDPQHGQLLHTEHIAEPNHDAVVMLASRPRVLTSSRTDVGPIIAAFVERGSAIHFYVIDVRNEAEPMMQVGHLDVPRPISAVFDQEGTLWVVTEHHPFIHCFCPPTFEETSHPDWFPDMAVQLRRNLEPARSVQAVRTFLETHLRQHTLRAKDYVQPNVMESNDRPSKKTRGSSASAAHPSAASSSHASGTAQPSSQKECDTSQRYGGGSMDVEM
eukprot:TRINITY_DN12734_c0_g1_i1.p1 TRINITY_DN12734_c0_g1~~TRINITY_DN12734_c0_g1_i1.p1  ORF type:complete len:427 (-),score=85.20 TRINITY_DN12734_c0_g1_i1:360-1640(-)